MVEVIKIQTPLGEFSGGYVIQWDEENLAITKGGNEVMNYRKKTKKN
jgi:hypothetical protein